MHRLLSLAMILCCALTTLVGCSDLGMSDVAKNPISSSRFNAGCELVVEDFKYILEKDISGQISCLQKNIDLFMRVVESNGPRGYLSRQAFEQYVIKNMPDFKPENVRAIKSVFEIAHLLFGDDRNYLSPSSVKKIFDFVYLFNREVPSVYFYFSDATEDMPYGVHENRRAYVFAKTDGLARALLDIFKDNRGDQIHKINILEILESFTSETNGEVLEQAKAVLFVKRMILGGAKDELTHLELSELLSKFGNIGSVGFDLYRVKKIDLNQLSLMEFVQSDLELVERLLHYPADSGERLFSIDDLIAAVPYFFDDSDFPDLKPYRKELIEAKMMLTSLMPYIPGEEEQNLEMKTHVLPGELKVLLDHGKDLVRRGTIFHKIFAYFKPYLQSPGPVNINYNNYLLQFPTHGKYVQEFARIANTYRYFRHYDRTVPGGVDSMPFYSQAYRRNAEGMVEAGLMEYVFTILARRYGKKMDNVVGSYAIDLAQLQGAIKIYKEPLVKEGLITEGRELKLMENITLLMTLFQSMSNGDGWINVSEGSAFFTQVFSAMQYADYFQEEISKLCPVDERGRITDINCHREKYFGVLCDRFGENFPLLLESLGMKNCHDKGDQTYIKEYLKKIEFVGRTCTVFKDGTDVPITSDDYMPIMVMLQTIEGAVSRFDTNRNNKLDPSEVRKAYDEVLYTAIEALVEQQADIIAKLPFNLGSAISKKVYYYLIKHKAIPKKVGDYLKLITIGATSADRDTFAAVLKIVAEQGEPSTFDCEKLR